VISKALDPNGYYYLNENQSLTTLSEHAEVMQAVRVLVRSFLEEWWIDPYYGIDYLGKILKRDFNPSIAASEVRRKASALDGVQRVYGVTVKQSADHSTITIAFSVLSVYSAEIEKITEILAL
jgi:hypothetical protein